MDSVEGERLRVESFQADLAHVDALDSGLGLVSGLEVDEAEPTRCAVLLAHHLRRRHLQVAWFGQFAPFFARQWL